MQSMYDLVGDKIREIFDAQVVDIGIIDEEGYVRIVGRSKETILRGGFGRSSRIARDSFAVNEAEPRRARREHLEHAAWQ